MSDNDPKADNLDLAIGWLQKSIDELSDVTRRIQAQKGGPVLASTATRQPPVSGQASASPIPALPDILAQPASDQPPTVPDDGSKPGSTTPLLDRIGRDLTKLAAAGHARADLRPGHGDASGSSRSLLPPDQAQPGPARRRPASARPRSSRGWRSGSRAGKVPDALKDTRIIEVPLGGLVAGTQYRGQLEERMEQLVREASQPGIVLFLDEIHLLEGAGHREGGVGAAEVLKPALARGDIAVIGATTPEAYRDYDRAGRRTRAALHHLSSPGARPAATPPDPPRVRDGLDQLRGVTVTDDALDVLLDFADQLDHQSPLPGQGHRPARSRRSRSARRRAQDGRQGRRRAHDERMGGSALRPTPTLERFGRDLIRLGHDGKLGPIVGRDREIEAIIEILLRHTKRNPHPARPGRFAARPRSSRAWRIRMASGDVPEQLQDVRLFDVRCCRSRERCRDGAATASSDFLLEARHPSVIVFFDEIHQLAAPAVTRARPGAQAGPRARRHRVHRRDDRRGVPGQHRARDAALARRFTPDLDRADGCANRRAACSPPCATAWAKHAA